jgi:hypothetical protein
LEEEFSPTIPLSAGACWVGGAIENGVLRIAAIEENVDMADKEKRCGTSPITGWETKEDSGSLSIKTG